MVKWKYELRDGARELRRLIDRSLEYDRENNAKIIEQIQVCCKRLLNQLTDKDKEYYEDDIQDLLDVMDGEADALRNNPDIVTNDWGYDSTTELIDGRLAQFYDICDDCRCWIAI